MNHDEQCERGMRLRTELIWRTEPYVAYESRCNCRYRRRIASGDATPPPDLDLSSIARRCSRCGQHVDRNLHKEWECYRCGVRWLPNGRDAQFTDHHPDLGVPVETVKAEGGVL